MRKFNLVFIVAALSLCSSAIADSGSASCNQDELKATQDQLKAKDAQIAALLAIIAGSNGNHASSSTVVVEHPYNCQGVCIQSLYGNGGWRHPGELNYYSSSKVSAPLEADAFNAMVSNCQQNMSENLAKNSEQFNASKSSIAGWIPVKNYNAADTDAKKDSLAVKSFRNVTDMDSFCHK